MQSILNSAFIRPLVVFALLFFSGFMVAQERSQDDQPHIQPRGNIKTTPTPTPTPAQAGPEQQQGPSSASPEESSSKDSQIDLNARPSLGEPEKEDDSVLRPYDPHRAAKDVEVGQYYLRKKNLRAALERFNDALLYKPDDAEAIFGLASTQEKLDLPDQAFENYTKYLKILPNGPYSKEAQAGVKRLGAHVSNSKRPGPVEHDIDVGETYLAKNNFYGARDRFEEALLLSPDNPLIYFRLGQCYQGLQQLDPARLHYRKYLQLEPSGRFAADAKKAIGQIELVLGKSE